MMTGPDAAPRRRFDGVLFDLLTALLDSWSLWNAVAGGAEPGRRWRAEYLQRTYRTGAYRPYEDMVAEAAEAVGLSRGLAAALAGRYGDLRPWPDVPATLGRLAAAGMRLGVVTNCSEQLGRIAARRVGIDFDVVVTAEGAGAYKPHPRTYTLALAELGVAPERCLFVAGSAYDLVGTAAVGLATYWHDRVGMVAPDGALPLLAHHSSLQALPEIALG
jgi:2-haloalkanoic acid dehalogenase type II